MARCPWTTKIWILLEMGHWSDAFVELGFRPAVLIIKSLSAS